VGKTLSEIDVAELTQSIGLLVRRVRAAAAAEELSLTEASVLGRLEREGPATTADLARAENMKPQSMGATVAALEAQGLLERKAHPTDGRQQLLSLTVKGEAVRNRIRSAKRGWLAQAISGLADEDRGTLFAAGKIIRQLAESDPL
jgi:DNA-binding MarR family transcriptional regulator